MNKMTIIIAFLTIVACQKKNSKVKPEVGKTFKSVKLERYSVKDGNPDSVSLASYITKEFDSIGLETKSVYYSSDNSIMMQFENEYENGNKTKIDWVNGKNEKVKYVKMIYDEDDKLVRSESYNLNDEFQSGFIHQWKDNGRTEEKGPIEEGKDFKPNAIYKYNEQQEMISLVEFDENDSLYGTFKWKYIEFNDDNQWTKRHMIFNDTLVRVEKREIRY